MKTDLRTYRTVGAMVALLFSKAFRRGENLGTKYDSARL